MKLFKVDGAVLLQASSALYRMENQDWDSLVNQENLYNFLEVYASTHAPIETTIDGEKIEAPIGSQEIWAAGVTYLRSKEARMDEAKESGAADFYAKVYVAKRPELFFKSTAARCAGPDQEVMIRRDSHWNVPEPELTLFANAAGKIVGYTIGNDMSSRDIEGENPLYLPQAKCYERSAAIGPCLLVPSKPIDADTQIHMSIERNKEIVFSGSISINQMKRTHEELIGYLFMEMDFPQGVYLMTGTCLVPPNDFTLAVGDLVHMSIDGIGSLRNKVAIKQ
jgi:2-dehydro-3-deoxy-D-arabinonate dehydratase